MVAVTLSSAHASPRFADTRSSGVARSSRKPVSGAAQYDDDNACGHHRIIDSGRHAKAQRKRRCDKCAGGSQVKQQMRVERHELDDAEGVIGGQAVENEASPARD